jgi:hypothetical protein
MAARPLVNAHRVIWSWNGKNFSLSAGGSAMPVATWLIALRAKNSE